MGSRRSQTENSEACIEIYDKMAPQYGAISSADTYKLPTWLIRELEPFRGRRPAVLDCACASGNLAGMLGKAGVDPSALVGLDISAEMVRLARESGAYTKVLQADLSVGLPSLGDQRFDLVVANGCFEFIVDPSRCLAGALRLAQPGATLLCTFEKADANADAATAEIVIEPYGRKLRRFPRDLATVRSLVASSGWKLEEAMEGPAYVSPTTGIAVNYWYCRARA